MARRNSPLSDARQSVRGAASHPWIEKLVRFGYAAKGIVYFVVGLLAAQAAFTTGGRTTDNEWCTHNRREAPFRRISLNLSCVGLVGYVLWRIVQAVFDPEYAGEETGHWTIEV